MFLPVVILDRYGWQGLLMFAIPNVVGCTAFGYVLKTPERSKALVEKYRGVMACFAVVTVAFHVFFLACVARYFINGIPAWGAIGLPAVALAVAVALGFLANRFWSILATIVWCTSVGIGLVYWPGSMETNAVQTHPWQDVIWLLPITTFGFLLCPYLDPTLHRALQSTPSRHSFGIFGVAFAIMIGLTCLYRDMVVVGLATIILVHFVSQSVFTMSAHIREGWLCTTRSRRLLFAICATVACIVALGVAHRTHSGVQQMIDDYLRFFVFYGLLFPGIVAAFMWTKRSFTPLRAGLFVLVALCSLPLLEAGYIGEDPWFTILPVVVFATWAFVDQPKQRLA